MKKIFYLVFFISLCFLVNVKFIHAAEGYCEYSLTRYSEGNGMFVFEDDDVASVKFKVDTSKKNKVVVEWYSNYDGSNISKTDKIYQFYGPNSNLINYKIDFSADDLYNKIVKGNEFSCPKLYGIYDATNFSLTMYYDDRVGIMGTTFVQLNLLNEKKPSNLEQEKLINQCGVGITDEKYGLPENMTVTFKKYTSRNEVCINYFRGSSFCKNYVAGNELSISTETGSITKIFIFEDKDLKKIFENITASSTGCINLWVDSSNVSAGVFRISTEKSNNGLDSEITTEGYDETVKIQQILDVTQFKQLLGALKSPLGVLAPQALNYALTIDGNKNATLNDVDANNLLCSGGECSTNGKYYTEQGLRNIRQYCNELYSNSDKYKNSQDRYNKRLDECVDFFNGFYNELINQGIIENLSNYCGVLSQDFAAKLKYFLNIIKIAGPLLALGLGTVDFVKVLANGDADKEMKNAFKRFLTRLGAAALLFLVPIILAFLLDLFMKPGLGYDSNNPFCDIVDWNG